ncbi:DEXX-box ATPase, partial [mine drainage metagenome]
MNFVDRTAELSSLEDSYSAKSSNLIVVYGRRRIGKTELIKRFGGNKEDNFVYYLCDGSPLDEQVRRIAMLIGRTLNDNELIEFGAAGIEAIFYKIAKAKTKAKLIMVLDEFQNLAKLDRAIPSIFQRIWDLYVKDSGNLMLVLSGSSISMMRSEVLNYSAPLYGRSTGIFLLKPLSLEYSMRLAPEHTGILNKLYIYFIFGGIPAYYSALSSGMKDYGHAGIREVIGEILKEGSIFTSEPNLLLSEEVRNDTIYMQILEFIAKGINKPGEIASKAGIAHGNLSKYTGLLEYLSMIEKEM